MHMPPYSFCDSVNALRTVGTMIQRCIRCR